jgi:hypothetical protein
MDRGREKPSREDFPADFVRIGLALALLALLGYVG